MIRFLVFAVFALLPMLAWGEGSFCAIDMSTGFAYRVGEWRERSFKPDEKYIVRTATQRDRDGLLAIADALSVEPPYSTNAKWAVVEVGRRTPFAGCPDFGADGHLFCRGPLAEFRMNKNSLHFLRAYLSGYWDLTPGDEAADTPSVSIGNCSPM